MSAGARVRSRALAEARLRRTARTHSRRAGCRDLPLRRARRGGDDRRRRRAARDGRQASSHALGAARLRARQSARGCAVTRSGSRPGATRSTALRRRARLSWSDLRLLRRRAPIGRSTGPGKRAPDRSDPRRGGRAVARRAPEDPRKRRRRPRGSRSTLLRPRCPAIRPRGDGLAVRPARPAVGREPHDPPGRLRVNRVERSRTRQGERR